MFVGLVALVVVPLMETMGSSQEPWDRKALVSSRGVRIRTCSTCICTPTLQGTGIFTYIGVVDLGPM